MCNPNRHLLIIYDINITYLTYILLVHIQHIRSEERADDPNTATASTPIVIGPTSKPTFPKAPFSDTSEENYPFNLPSEEPPEPPTAPDPVPR